MPSVAEDMEAVVAMVPSAATQVFPATYPVQWVAVHTIVRFPVRITEQACATTRITLPACEYGHMVMDTGVAAMAVGCMDILTTATMIRTGGGIPVLPTIRIRQASGNSPTR